MFQTLRKGEIAMLKNVKNQENVITLFFVVILLLVGIYAFFGKCLIDFIYFGIMLYYFFKFLKLKKNGK